MKLKTMNAVLYGQRLSVPVDGTITIGPDGIVNVSDQCAGHLLTLPDWERAEGAKNDEQEEAEVSDDAIIAGIKKMSLEELIESVSEAGYPETEWKRFKKNQKLMAAYAIKKYEEEMKAEANAPAPVDPEPEQAPATEEEPKAEEAESNDEE
nr:MAG TPA: hypothetical protein [Herelleviridae sp.]